MHRLLAALSLLMAMVASAQQPPQPPRPDDDPVGRQLFPPEMIMGHQEELGLKEAQRTAIRTEVSKVQGHFVDLQWQLSAEAEKLAGLLRAMPIDENKVLEQADKVMALEREVKRMHLSMLIRIKNQLTPEQIGKLQEIRKRGP